MLLERLIKERGVKLIAEEAYKLPTTTGFRLACRADIPWIDVDMTDAERREAAIYDELNKRPSGPLLNDGSMLQTVSYLPCADGVREEHWVKRVMEHRVDSALIVCGLLHMSPLAEKLTKHGCHVPEPTNVCDQGWYVKTFGPCQVVEENGRRWCEYPVK
jgi:hypothetical protein